MDKYGNITFGEVSRLLIDTIGQNVILDRMPKNEQRAFKRKLEDMYKYEAVYRNFSTAEPESPQWYVEQCFKDLENKYKLPCSAMIVLDSFTWQLFYAIRSYTPFEKPKKETALFLLRKEIFGFIFLKEKPLDGIKLNISENSIIIFLTDSYKKIFKEVFKDYKYKETFYKELTNYCDENPKKKFKENMAYRQDIFN